MSWKRHGPLYGALDLCAVLPFVEHYGVDHLSPEGRQLARVLDRALRGESPLGRHIRVELTELLNARHDGHHDDVVLHRQHLIRLLARYGRKRRREGVCRRELWTMSSCSGLTTKWT